MFSDGIPSLVMDFTIPNDIKSLLDDLDHFIEDVIRPIENEDDNIRFFDHRREDARTDWERDGLPNEEWETCLLYTSPSPRD